MPEGRFAAEFSSIYTEVPEGDVVLLVNRHNLMIELAINMGDFSQTYDIRVEHHIKIQK